jgi:gas vesicle protein
MNSGKIVLGVLAGLAAGAAIGILFAPDKGSNTRRKIAQKGEDYMSDLKDKFNGLVENFTNKFDTAKKDVDELVDKGKTKFDHAKTNM